MNWTSFLSYLLEGTCWIRLTFLISWCTNCRFLSLYCYHLHLHWTEVIEWPAFSWIDYEVARGNVLCDGICLFCFSLFLTEHVLSIEEEFVSVLPRSRLKIQLLTEYNTWQRSSNINIIISLIHHIFLYADLYTKTFFSVVPLKKALIITDVKE